MFNYEKKTSSSKTITKTKNGEVHKETETHTKEIKNGKVVVDEHKKEVN